LLKFQNRLFAVPDQEALDKDLFFLKKNSLPSVPDLALGKDLIFFLNFFAECPRSGTRQIFFLKNTLPSAPGTTLGKDLFFFIISLPSVPVDALGKVEFF